MAIAPPVEITLFLPRGIVDVQHVTCVTISEDGTEGSWAIDIAMIQGQMMQIRFDKVEMAVDAFDKLRAAKRKLLGEWDEDPHVIQV